MMRHTTSSRSLHNALHSPSLYRPAKSVAVGKTSRTTTYCSIACRFCVGTLLSLRNPITSLPQTLINPCASSSQFTHTSWSSSSNNYAWPACITSIRTSTRGQMSSHLALWPLLFFKTNLLLSLSITSCQFPQFCSFSSRSSFSKLLLTLTLSLSIVSHIPTSSNLHYLALSMSGFTNLSQAPRISVHTSPLFFFFSSPSPHQLILLPLF